MKKKIMSDVVFDIVETKKCGTWWSVDDLFEKVSKKFNDSVEEQFEFFVNGCLQLNIFSEEFRDGKRYIKCNY